MRTFGDLMQFFESATDEKKPPRPDRKELGPDKKEHDERQAQAAGDAPAAAESAAPAESAMPVEARVADHGYMVPADNASPPPDSVAPPAPIAGEPSPEPQAPPADEGQV